MKRIITDNSGNVIFRDGIRIPYDSNSSYDVLINLDVIRGLYEDVKNNKWLFIKYYGLGELKSTLRDRTSSSNKLRKREVFALKVSADVKEEISNQLLNVLNQIKNRQPYEKIIEALKEIVIYFDDYVIRKISPITKEIVYLRKRNIATEFKPKMTFKLTNVKVVRYKKMAAAMRKRLKNSTKTEDIDPCWNGYKQIGNKKKNGKSVPNCVPIN